MRGPGNENRNRSSTKNPRKGRAPLAAPQEAQRPPGKDAQVRQVKDIAVQGPGGPGEMEVVIDPALRQALLEVAEAPA